MVKYGLIPRFSWSTSMNSFFGPKKPVAQKKMPGVSWEALERQPRQLQFGVENDGKSWGKWVDVSNMQIFGPNV